MRIAGQGLFVSFLAATALMPADAEAQIYNCDGRWTNVPCKGRAEQVLPEKPVEAKSQQELDQNQIKSALHDLNTKRFNAKQKWGLSVDISSAEYLCTKPGPSVQTCLDKISELSDLIDTRVNEKEQLQVAQEKNRLEEEKQQSEENSSAVVVIEQEPLRPPGVLPIYPPYVPPSKNPYDKPPRNPYAQPPRNPYPAHRAEPVRPELPGGHLHRHTQGSGISVRGSGAGVSASGSAGSTVIEDHETIHLR